jgi:hypothetical protein
LFTLEVIEGYIVGIISYIPNTKWCLAFLQIYHPNKSSRKMSTSI